MEATVAERGQVVIPKSARDLMGIAAGMRLTVTVEAGKLVMTKKLDDTISRLQGKFKLASGFKSTDEAMRAIRGRAPGDKIE